MKTYFLLVQLNTPTKCLIFEKRVFTSVTRKGKEEFRSWQAQMNQQLGNYFQQVGAGHLATRVHAKHSKTLLSKQTGLANFE